jgi:tRNA pseudouridine38-40 synthase
MQQCAELFLQHHDFASMALAGSDVKTTLCQLSVSRLEYDLEHHLLAFHIQANRFLRGMVRALVGTLVEVGRERVSLSEVSQALQARNRSAIPANAPPQGLTFEEATYTPGTLLVLAESHKPVLVSSSG